MRTRAGAPIRVPAGATSDGDGIEVGDGPVVVEAYIDFLCPFCRQFEERSGTTLKRLVAARAITLVYHPLGFLDRLSTTQYSSRAGSASGCAADGRRFVEFKDALYRNQPPEGGPGLPDEELIALGRTVELEGPSFDECVLAHAYIPWVGYVTQRAMARGVAGTPSVFVQGVAVPANAAVIAAAVAEAP